MVVVERGAVVTVRDGAVAVRGSSSRAAVGQMRLLSLALDGTLSSSPHRLTTTTQLNP